MSMNKLICGDSLNVMRDMPNDSVDLVFGSPPYEDARTYGIDFNLKGQDWVDWMVGIYEESIRISKGLVAFVVQGRTRKFKWSCTPALLIADLHRAGFNVRKPVLYRRTGIPGSGGPDWLKNTFEWIVCVNSSGRLPWSDNTACGWPPKCKKVGGPVSNRFSDGSRPAYFPSMTCTSGYENGDASWGKKRKTNSPMPKKANPGDIVDCGASGGGQLGSKLAHENEAPFPLKLAEFFIKSFCPPNGTTLDPFSGSGTTGHACVLNGRNYTGIDCRQSQIKLSRKRLVAAKKELK